MNALTLAAWCAAIFLAADLFSHTVALRLIALGVGVAAIVVALLEARLRKTPLSFEPVPPLWIPFALWGAWAGLSYFWSVEPARTAKEFTNEIVYAAAAFWMCWCAAQAKGAARIILPVVALAAVGACVSAIYFYFGKGILAYPYGPHGGAGNHSSAIITLLPCVVVGAWVARRQGRPRVLEISLVLLAGLFLLSGYTTLNRIFWPVTALQLVVIGSLLLRRASKLGALKIGRAAMLGLGLLALIVIAGGATMMLRIQEERGVANAIMVLSGDPRLQLWPEVLERIAERPIFGSGFGRGLFRADLRNELGEGNLWHSHNLVLDVALQTGLVGVMVLGALLLLTLRQGWRLSFSPDVVATGCGVALFAIVLGMIARNMTDVLWVRQNALFYWGVVGTLLAFGNGRITRASQTACTSALRS